MDIVITRFDPETAYTDHDGTILASPVLPAHVKAPFAHQYGHLTRARAMAGHQHDTDEAYIVLSGTGHVVLGGETRAVSAGDVIAIPHNTWHTMLTTETSEVPFLWAALWWNPVEGGARFDGIDVKRFDEKIAYLAHVETILADRVLPDSLSAPFHHQYGYHADGGEMEYHAHDKTEVYIVFSGHGEVVIDGVRAQIGPGDVIDIPPKAMHTIVGRKSEPILWAAFWWDTIR